MIFTRWAFEAVSLKKIRSTKDAALYKLSPPNFEEGIIFHMCTIYNNNQKQDPRIANFYTRVATI